MSDPIGVSLADQTRPYDASLAARFWSKVRKGAPDECWEWNASTDNHGYGQIGVGPSLKKAHRVAYELVIGPIPPSLTIDHLCRNRACVNPGHLEPVTNRENILRGTAPSARFAARTHCAAGHLLSGKNITTKKCGARVCLQCNRNAQRVWHERKNGRYRAGKYDNHCSRGHEYSPENTYVRPNGTRMCLACSRAARRRRK